MSLPVTILTRANCPLCDKAKTAILASGVLVRIDEVDIDRDAELQRLYTNDVPVIFVDGREAFRHRVAPDEFARYVSQHCCPN